MANLSPMPEVARGSRDDSHIDGDAQASRMLKGRGRTPNMTQTDMSVREHARKPQNDAKVTWNPVSNY